MFAQGLVAEVQRLLGEFDSLSRTAGQAVGYREVIARLAGRQDLDETIEQVKVRTRQFARRQETWFRSLSECRSVVQRRDTTADQVAAEIANSANPN